MTYKYDLQVKLGRKVIFHQLFEFTEKEQQTYIESILETGVGMESEIEDVFIRVYGNKKYFKEFPEASSSIKIEDIAKNHPKILVAGALQEQCYSSVPFPEVYFPRVCEKTECLVDASREYFIRCLIID